MNDNLYIVGGENFIFKNEFDKNSKVIFLDKIYENFQNQFSLLNYFEENQNLLREKWLILQEQVFKKIRTKLDADEDFKYLLCNLFFEASPNKIKSIYQFFKLYTTLEYIKKEKIKNVYLLNISNEVKNFFNSNINNFSFSFKIISSQKKAFSKKKIIEKLEKKNFIFSIFSSLVNEYKKKKQNIFSKKSQSSKVVFSYYYPGGNSFESRFLNRYFEEVSYLLNSKYDWLFQYVGDTSKLNYENNLIKDNVNSFGFLDAYFSFLDFPKIITKFFKIRKKLKSIELNKLFFFENVNYLCLFKSDWLTSVTVLLFKLLVFEKKISNFLINNSKVNEILYLMEFQPWEQILNKVSKKLNIKTKGVIHSIARPNTMNYYHPKIIHPYFYLPSLVGVNSEFSKSLMLKDGFSNNQVMEVEAQRYNYLADIDDKIDNATPKSKNSILIFTSNIPKETIEMLELFALSKMKFDKIYIKEHHLLPVSSIIKSLNMTFPSYEILNCKASEAFKYSDIVFIANGSSVLLESVIKKKITVSLISLSTLPMPAVEKAENLYFVYDLNSFKEILNKLNFKSTNDISHTVKNDYLYLNKGLTLWFEFLNK
jgi:surface carbohydrate biosynthesis protein (TIGR04326 family)